MLRPAEPRLPPACPSERRHRQGLPVQHAHRSPALALRPRSVFTMWGFLLHVVLGWAFKLIQQ